MTNKLIFLGGTCGNNNWRNDFTSELVKRGVPPEAIFNPVVPNWTPEDQAKEEEAKSRATSMIFYIADPKQEGINVSAYSLVEATMALYDSPKSTVVVFDTEGQTGHVLKALKQSEKVLRKRFPNAAIYGTEEEALESGILS